MIEWLIGQLFYLDQCGPAAVNWWGWALVAVLFGSGGVFLGALITSHDLNFWD